MKTTLKLSTLLVALVSVFTFSSCLNDDNNTQRATYYSFVTIAGDDFIGYTFYADFGATLRPTTASIMEVLPRLGESGAKRAYVAFDLASETENGKTLEAGKSYDIIVRADPMANYAIPTFETVMSIEPTDSLHTKNQHIQNVNKDIWAINGYVNAQLTIDYHQEKPFYLNTYYTSEDIDVANNTLNLNIYFNKNSETSTGQGSSIISFKLPEQLASNFTDSVKLVLNAITGYDDNQLTKVGECKVALEDFHVPMY